MTWIDAETGLAWAQVAAAFVTALATIALWNVTRVLAAETRRMAAATSQPHVVATLEINQWSTHHFDLHVANSGNGPAYGIEVEFDPPLPAQGLSVELPTPLQNISVLRPGQAIMSYAAKFTKLEDHSFTVTVTWSRVPAGPREINRYSLTMRDFDGTSFVGDRSAAVATANELKRIREIIQRLRQD